MRKIILPLILLLFLWGCAPRQEVPGAPADTTPSTRNTTPPQTTAALPPETLPPETVPAADPVILACHAPGILESRSDCAVIDYSNSADGYCMAQYFGETQSRLKLRITGPDTTYTYDLPVGEWIALPLSQGDGHYKVSIYRNTSGSRYAVVMTAELDAVLADEFAPFLRPNRYVSYTDAPNTMALGAELCAGLEQPLQKVAAVYDHVVGAFTYDYEKAATVKSGYLPILDQVLETETGICFDYAAVMTAMLRSQQVPCKLVVGYAGNVYHAWISVWTEENGWIDGAIFFDGHVWKRMDPTFASSGERSPEIMDFIENGNYVTKYLY